MMFIEITHAEYSTKNIKFWILTGYSPIHRDYRECKTTLKEVLDKYTHIAKILKLKKATPYHGNRIMRKYDKTIILNMIKNLRLSV